MKTRRMRPHRHQLGLMLLTVDRLPLNLNQNLLHHRFQEDDRRHHQIDCPLPQSPLDKMPTHRLPLHDLLSRRSLLDYRVLADRLFHQLISV